VVLDLGFSEVACAKSAVLATSLAMDLDKGIDTLIAEEDNPLASPNRLFVSAL
jgi:hypothetical protein